MHKNIILSCLSLSIVFTSHSYADTGEFITIIGPDGLPMVVPHPDRMQNKKDEVKSVQPKKAFNFFNSGDKKQCAEVKQTEERSLSPKAVNQQMSSKAELISVPQAREIPAQPLKASAVEQQSQKVQQKSQATDAIIKNTANTRVNQVSDTANVKTSDDLPYTIIDGEKYYETEYLESKEFNLEDKKRFYQIPTGTGNMTGGASNWDVVEREKGVNMSWFNSQADAGDKQKEPIVLGKNYKVIVKEELVAVLPLQCIDDKAKRKSKTFQKDETLSLFPRKPFKDEFDYELITLNQPIQNVKLASYANSNKNPTYYWPIAIFLDEQGCIIEGASAFHTRSYPSTALQSESVEGVIYIPEKSKYVMLSALEQAADLPELRLSNQGQIKLTVLR